MTSLLPKEAVAKATKELGLGFKRLSQLERLAVVTAYSEGCVNHDRMMEICNDHAADISAALRTLVNQKMLEQTGHGRGTIYFPVGHKPEKGELDIVVNVTSSNVTSNDGTIRPELLRLAEPARQNGKMKRENLENLILLLCRKESLSSDELARLLNRDARGLRNRYIIPLVNKGRLQCKYPTKTHPNQRYKATESDVDTP